MKNLPHLAFLKKIKGIFQKKPQILNVSRNLTVLIAFYGKFAIIWCIKTYVQNVNEHRERNWQTLVKKNVPFERKIFLLYLINMLENFKKMVRNINYVNFMLILLTDCEIYYLKYYHLSIDLIDIDVTVTD